MLRLLAPFTASLLWTGIIALALHPFYRRIVALLGGRTALAASLMKLLTLDRIIGPAMLLPAVLVSLSIDLYHWTAEGVDSDVAIQLWNHPAVVISLKILSGPLFVTLLTSFIQTYREEFFEQENPD
jgi:hypothetical protein